MSRLGPRRRIDADLVRRLLATQFPEWARLPVTRLASGHDNRSFRLGDGMLVRLPSHERYAPQADKERRWLPVLAPRLPLPIPAPLAIGEPGEGYPWPWQVLGWIEGDTAATAPVGDLARFAVDLAAFLVALQRIDAAQGPPAGPHSFWRGGPLAAYDAETRAAIAALGGRIDAAAAAAMWDAALAATWDGPPVWFHGDVAPGNLIVRDGRLAAVIDFGCCGVGDPACDLVIAWTWLDEPARAAFRAALGLDDACWARARGWALWKALIVLARGEAHHDYAAQRRTLGELMGTGALRA
ncbi:MAG TPA: aminoglycoside phosphotransferase family protein [Caulobacteraceae bacterium]|nr:aminoglycoside phosphotransferase family protein [Caulobacteraceae bacterium]